MSKRLIIGIIALAVILVFLVAIILGSSLSDENFSTGYNAPMQSLDRQSSGGYAAEAMMAANLVSSQIVEGRFSGEDEIAGRQETQERLVIRNATLSLQVEDARQVADRITSIVNEMGGWVVSSQISTFTNSAGEEDAQGSIQVRVPAENLDATLAQIRSLGIKVFSEQITGQDVTAEYVDLQSQLGNLQAAEEQLQIIMDDAQNTQDVLSVYNELVRIRGEIDVIQGRMNYLSQSAAYSSITVTLSPEPPDEEELDTDTWSPGEDVEDAFDALIEGFQTLGTVLIYAAICGLPLAVLILVPAYIIYRRWFRKAA
jgi:hypothetical protein